MFKPTRATKHPFRPTAADAMSYFVGAEVMGADDFVGEDGGFAINGGRGWSNVVFRNHMVKCYGDVALASRSVSALLAPVAFLLTVVPA